MLELEINHKDGTINGELACGFLSHFVLDGEVYVNEACYADFDHVPHDVEDVRVIFMKKNKWHSNYIDWVINKSEFKDFYITKDVEEGFTNGFSIDLSKGTYDELVDALRIIRMTYEFEVVFNAHLIGRKTIAAHIESVLHVVKHYGFENGHTLSSSTESSFHEAVKKNKPFNKCKEYITCAV